MVSCQCNHHTTVVPGPVLGGCELDRRHASTGRRPVARYVLFARHLAQGQREVNALEAAGQTAVKDVKARRWLGADSAKLVAEGTAKRTKDAESTPAAATSPQRR